MMTYAPPLLVVATLTVLGVGYLDHSLGEHVYVFLLHLAPIGLVTWYLGKTEGAVVAAFSLLVWLAAGATSMSVPTLIANVVTTATTFFGLNWLLAKLQDTREESRHLAETDTLTGVLNRRGFWRAAEKELRRAQRYSTALTVAYLDLDNFKKVNDTYGHPTGDALLTLVAQTISHATRGPDAVARLGGDEFALLLPHTTRAQAEAVAHKVQKQLHEAMERYHWPVTVSIGLAGFERPTALLTVDNLLRQADVAMYQAKQAGKNRVVSERDDSVTPLPLN